MLKVRTEMFLCAVLERHVLRKYLTTLSFRPTVTTTATTTTLGLLLGFAFSFAFWDGSCDLEVSIAYSLL